MTIPSLRPIDLLAISLLLGSLTFAAKPAPLTNIDFTQGGAPPRR